MSDQVALLVAVALLLGNAFFVGAEFAVISVRRTQVEPRAAEGSGAARITLRALENVSLMLAASQLGITMCSLGLGAIAEPAVAHLIEGPLASLGVPEDAVHPIAFAIALSIVVYLHMVLGEMVPKNIAIASPEASALLLAPPLYFVATVFKPIVWVMNHSANLVLRLIRVEPKDEVASAFTADEVASFVAQSRAEGLLDAEAHELVAGALGIGERTVADVAVPVADLEVLPHGATIADAEAACVRTGFSRFPIYGSNGFEGYVHLKDLLGTAAEDLHRPIGAEQIRRLTLLEASTTLDDALAAMQRAGSHLSLVLASDGAATGVAMLEDLVEEMVGEIVDAAQQITS